MWWGKARTGMQEKIFLLSSCANVRLGSEADLVSGLYRKGQLEIGVQQARKVRPDLSDDALFELARHCVSCSERVVSPLSFFLLLSMNRGGTSGAGR